MRRTFGPKYIKPLKRRIEGKTNYRKRIALLKSKKTRLVVRKSNRYIIVGFANFSEKGDVFLTSASSKALSKFGFNGKCNTPSAYLTALYAGKNAIKKGVKDAVLDIGLHKATKGSLVFGALKGALDAGISIHHSKEKLPSEERIKGQHLSEEMEKKFEECKNKILLI